MIISTVFVAICIACFAAGIGIGIGLGLLIGTFVTADNLTYGFAPAADGANQTGELQ